MKNTLCFILIVFLFSSCSLAREFTISQQWQDPTDRVLKQQEIVELAKTYHLLSPGESLPDFGKDDLGFWVDSNYTKREMIELFKARERIIALAKKHNLKIPSQGDLSFFAEELLAQEMNLFEIRSNLEAKQTLPKIKTVQKEGFLEREKEILSLADQFGLTVGSDSTAPFTKGDAAYWAQKALTMRAITEQFHLRKKVIDLAGHTHYPLRTQGDISYFTGLLQSGKLTEQELLTRFQ